MRNLLRAFLLLQALLAPGTARAVQPGEVLADPALEARARALSANLRCLVCQNQSIDESDAPLARDLRLLVRERLVAGDSDAQVERFLVARYGEFVLLRPPFAAHTLLLWLMPLILLAAAAAGIAWRLAAARRQPAPPPPLTPDERQRLNRLLNGPPPGEK
jgi:cytochrome c-type biogenesis protein CcmH